MPNSPWPVFVIGENGRRVLCLGLLLFNIIEVVIGCILMASSVNPSIGAILAFSRDARSLPWLLRIAGGLLVALHGPAALMAVDCWTPKKRIHWVAGLHCWWLLFLTSYGMASACLVLAAAQCRELHADLPILMPAALNSYAHRSPLRCAIDRLQATLHCCGDRYFTDWNERQWRPGDFQTVHNNQSDNENKTCMEDVVPFSCCVTAFLGPCIRHKAGWRIGRMRQSIYKEGCRELVAIQLIRTLTIIIGIQVTSLFIQISILVLTRFLQTGISSSVYQENISAPSPCWLFNDDFFRYHREFPTEDEELVKEWLMNKKKSSANMFKQVLKRTKGAIPVKKLNIPKPAKPSEEDALTDPDELRRRKARAGLVQNAIHGESQMYNVRELPFVPGHQLRKHPKKPKKTKKQ